MIGSLSFNSRTLGRVRPYQDEEEAEEYGFNSRTLGRVRLRSRTIELMGLGFNSRTLGRVRPKRSIPIVGACEFQFTHPGKGATTSVERLPLPVVFQFTHPGKGATYLTP